MKKWYKCLFECLPIISAGALLLTTIICGLVLSASQGHAVTKSSTATVNVTLSCTMSTSPGTGGTATTDGYSYSATIDPGNWKEIAGTIMTTTCTGTGNYSLYAIGYSGDSYDTPTNTQMISSNTGVANIPTGTATSGGTSNWAFKLATSGSYSPTIISPYNNYANIPGDDFTKIATYIPGTTGSATSSSVQAKYQVYITSTQPAGNYTGKVKYTMIYPNDAPAPTPLNPYCTDPSTCMQNTSSGCDKTLTDGRDGATYTTATIAGSCWMTQNLRFQGTDLKVDESDVTSPVTLTPYSLDKNDSSYTNHCDNTNGYNYACTKLSTNTNYGAYYNYCAASAGEVCNNSTKADATRSVCPAGWKLPTQSQLNALPQKESHFIASAGLAGNYNGGSLYNAGTDGYWWASTAGSATRQYFLRYRSDDGSWNVLRSYRYYGNSVRCIRAS